jgi:hypothetical protein
MKKLTVVCLALAAIFTVSCTKTAEYNVPAPKPDYFQLKTGNYWIYEGYRVDSNGVATATGDIDSAFIQKDTLIRGYTFYKLYENPYVLGYLQVPFFFRDSSGYLVDLNGSILASDCNFSDTLMIDTTNPNLYTGYLTMTGRDSLVKISDGKELPSITARKQIVPAPAFTGQVPVRYLYDVYAKGVGKIKTHSFYFSGHGPALEARLIRYKVQ